MHRIAHRLASCSSNAAGSSAGSVPRGSATTWTLKPCASARSIPRSVASCPAASASKQRKSRRVSRASSFSCALRERRPHRRDDGQEPRLPQREHVGVPLDDDRAILLRDRLAAGVEPVEQIALAEEVALRRVDVLRLERIVVVQLACLEAADAAACVGEREDEPPLEVVVAAPVGETRAEQLVLRVSLLHRAAHELSRRPARSRAGTSGRRLRRARATRGTRARTHPARCPTARARRTPSRVRARSAADPSAAARAPPPARSPRTRSRRRSGARETRSRRRSRAAPASRRTRSRRRLRRSRSTCTCRAPARR